MQYKQIHQFAEVLPGYAFRGAINHNPMGMFFVAQASNIDANQLFLDTDSLKRTDDAPIRAKAFLDEGDVLIASRTSMTGGFKACVFAGYEQPVIATSSTFIIRSDEAIVTSEYLSIFLNSAMGQIELNRDTSGSYIKALLRKQLLTVSIPILSLEEQKILADLSRNTSEQNTLLQRKIQLNQNILQGALFNKLDN